MFKSRFNCKDDKYCKILLKCLLIELLHKSSHKLKSFGEANWWLLGKVLRCFVLIFFVKYFKESPSWVKNFFAIYLSASGLEHVLQKKELDPKIKSLINVGNDKRYIFWWWKTEDMHFRCFQNLFSEVKLRVLQKNV